MFEALKMENTIGLTHYLDRKGGTREIVAVVKIGIDVDIEAVVNEACIRTLGNLDGYLTSRGYRGLSVDPCVLRAVISSYREAAHWQTHAEFGILTLYRETRTEIGEIDNDLALVLRQACAYGTGRDRVNDIANTVFLCQSKPCKSFGKLHFARRVGPIEALHDAEIHIYS